MAANGLYTNSMIDSCAFDTKFEPEASASSEILALADDGKFQLIIAHSTQKEIDHRNTPAEVKKRATERIFSWPVSLTKDEQRIRSEIHRILTGNGKPENVREDSEHVFEAQKYGGHFITTDGRILDRANDLEALCGICVLKPSAFLAKAKALLSTPE
jgi:hypothetical protein